MEFLIRFSQSHETFRMPEIQALALVAGADMKVIFYDVDVSTCQRWPSFFSFFFTIPDRRP